MRLRTVPAIALAAAALCLMANACQFSAPSQRARTLIGQLSGSPALAAAVASDPAHHVIKVGDNSEGAPPKVLAVSVLLSPDIHVDVAGARYDWKPQTDPIVSTPTQGFTDGRKFAGAVKRVAGVDAVVVERGTQTGWIQGGHAVPASIRCQVGELGFLWLSSDLTVGQLEKVAAPVVQVAVASRAER